MLVRDVSSNVLVNSLSSDRGCLRHQHYGLPWQVKMTAERLEIIPIVQFTLFRNTTVSEEILAIGTELW